ncbi:uncharacterized protein LOC134285957 [Aedes albopictus]|uniref:Reverse transcriptase n=1 Tax=Aedes albopictus TaxID=7160 RepID=A0ABM1YDK5_AEDAL
MNTHTGANNGQKKVNYQYEHGDQGPFRVIVELIDTQDGRVKINKLSLACTLRKMPLYKTHVTEMKQVGRNKLMVYFNNYQIANRLTTDEHLKDKNYRAYIPRHLVSVTGVIAGVPLDISAEEIMDELECEYPVMAVYRMNRHVNGKKEPTMRLSVTFRAAKLPEHVRIFCCSVGVRAFYRKTVLCQNCLRYNHLTANCKSKRRCENCSRAHDRQEEYNECRQPQRCLYCRTAHKTTDFNCPERTRQNNVQAIMARTSLTAIEAVEQFPIQTRNYYEALVDRAQEPTPAESFASMTAGKYKARFAPPPRPRKRTGVTETSVNIADQVVVMQEKKKKTDGECETNGVALFNKYKVTEAEKWKNQLRQAAKQQQERNDGMNDLQPTPSTSVAGASNQEDFSRFVTNMIGEDELLRVLNDVNYDVGVFSETWTRPGEEASRAYRISGYQILTARPDGYGGVGVYVQMKYNYQQISVTVQSDQIQIVAVKVLRLDVVIVGVYVAPSVPSNVFEAELNSIIAQLERFNRIIIAGDFNCHHYSWGNNYCDRKGTILMDAINASNLIVMNDGSKTFIPIDTTKQATAIDLTICSAGLYSQTDWKTIPKSVGRSEHLLIEASLITSDKDPRPIFVNHQRIAKEVASWNADDIQSLDDFKNKVKQCVDSNKKVSRHTPKAWWSDRVEVAWKEKMEAVKRFRNCSTIENAIEVKKCSATFTRLKNEGIKKQIEELAESVDPQTSSKILWSKIARISGKRNKRRVNNPIQEDERLGEEFLDVHVGQNDVDIEVPISYGPVCRYNLMDADKWSKILASKNSKSAPSGDMITYGMLKQIKPEVRDVIIEHINRMFVSGTLTYHLKEIKIVAIPKPGRDQSTVQGKRPIALIPTITKITNTAVLEKIQNHLQERCILPELSFGFRRNVSTSTCLNYVVNAIKQNKRAGFITAVTFIDLTNAYNAVKTDTLEETMQELLFPSEVIIWVTSFLKNRKIAMKVGEKTLTRIVSNGLPQGDVMSPSLFNVYTTKLHTIYDEDTILVQFADDFALIVRAKSIEALNQKMQIHLTNFTSKAKDLNLEINPNKTKIILFHGGTQPLNIKVDNTVIEKVNSHRYLGLYIDRFLGFGGHIRIMKEKIQERLKMLKVISSIRSGGHPQTMILLYNALVRSCVEYGSSTVNNTSTTNRKTIQTALNACLRKVTGCSKTTPLNSLLAVASQEPWDIRSEYIACKELAKNVAYRNPIYEQLQEIEDYEGDSEKLTYQEKQYLEHRNIFNTISPVRTVVVDPASAEVTINMSVGAVFKKQNTNPRVMKQMVLGLLNGKYKTRCKIYTDASNLDGTCGIGIFLEFSNRRISLRLEHQTSIMTAELLAIKVAADEVRAHQARDAVIFTDSLSSCMLLDHSQRHSERSEIADEIIRTCQEWNVDIQWIPSHIDIKGNDLADELAKHGAQHGELFEHPVLLKDAYLRLMKIKQEKVNNWYKDYANEKGRKFAEIQPEFKEKPWYYNLPLNNVETRTLNRLITGHDYSKYWLHKMKLKDSPICDFCNEMETAEHLVLHCKRYSQIRKQYDYDGKYQNSKQLFEAKDVNILRDVPLNILEA